MRKTDHDTVETITAKWKTQFDADEKQLGIATLGDEYRLRFPMLDLPGDIPPGTTILWGRGTDLQHCTAVILPLGPHGNTAHHNEQTFFANASLSRLLVGSNYIAEPASAFVTGIKFVPRPNHDLHLLQLLELIQPQKDISVITFTDSCSPTKKAFEKAHTAFFEAQRGMIFEAELQSGELTVSAWIGGRSTHGMEEVVFQSHIGFAIDFKAPQDMESALLETNKLCTYLSFLTHQCIYPADFSVSAQGEERPLRLYCRAFRTTEAREHTWVRNALILPEDDPTGFVNALTKWYANNEDALRGRYLYRSSFEEPYDFSTDRFLAIFQAVEGRISKAGYQFLAPDEFAKAETALHQALPDSPKLNALIGKLKSNNVESPRFILKQELPRLFAASRLTPRFDVNEFVERVYRRRNKSSHGGSRLEHEPIEAMVNDVLLLSGIYLLIECAYLGLDSCLALTKFQNAMGRPLPLRAA